MNNFKINKSLHIKLSTFIDRYGLLGLEQALQFYTDMQKIYICKNKTSISKFKISDIIYLEIQAHNITIYTNHGIYHKYGTLKNELKILSPYYFVKCNQSCIVSLREIKSIYNNDIILHHFTTF